MALTTPFNKCPQFFFIASIFIGRQVAIDCLSVLFCFLIFFVVSRVARWRRALIAGDAASLERAAIEPRRGVSCYLITMRRVCNINQRGVRRGSRKEERVTRKRDSTECGRILDARRRRGHPAARPRLDRRPLSSRGVAGRRRLISVSLSRRARWRGRVKFIKTDESAPRPSAAIVSRPPASLSARPHDANELRNNDNNDCRAPILIIFD